MSFTSIWSPAVYYYPNNFVQFAGLTWECIATNKGNEPPSSPTFWTQFGGGGGGGGGGQTLSLAGNNITLSGGGGSVDISTASAVASTTQKTSNQTFTSGVTDITDFQDTVTADYIDARSDVIARTNLLIGVLPAQTNVGTMLSSLTMTTNQNSNDILSLQGRVAFRDTTEFYVSNNGSDLTGDGSFLNPYQTIQKAVTEAELISSSLQICIIYVSGGHYTENVTFNKGYVILTSAINTQTNPEVVEITGTTTVNCGGGDDLFNRQVAFIGFQFTGAVNDTSTAQHSLTFQDCRFYETDRAIYVNASATNMRLYITNCEIAHNVSTGTNPLIEFNTGFAEIERVDFTASANVPCIRVAGTAHLSRLTLSSLTSETTSATAQPFIDVTSTSTSIQSIGQNSFTYSSATNKTASPSSAVIYNRGVAGATYILLSNIITLTGTNNANFAVYSGVGTQSIVSAFNNASPPNVGGLIFTNNIMSGKSNNITFFAYNAVN